LECIKVIRFNFKEKCFSNQQKPTHVFRVVELLQHVLANHGGRELDDEEEDVDGGGLGARVFGLKRDLKGLFTKTASMNMRTNR
jgi:hypothetical protein